MTVITEEMSALLRKHEGAGREQLIPILQDVQEALGCISRDSVLAIGRHLGLPPSKVYGVATFYNQFRFEPAGRFHILVCRGTACHVKGSRRVLESLQRALGIMPGQTTKDGLFSLEVVACVGACGHSPVISIGGEFHARVAPDDIEGILEEYRLRASEDTHV